MKPRLAVCVVAYNHERYIRGCLLSVLAQEVDAEVEILVGDDRSDDRTAQIVDELAAEHPGRIRAFRSERRLGGSMNYRRLLERAEADFIAHLDGDDYWLPGKLATQLAKLREHPEASAAYTNAVVCSSDGQLLGVFNNRLPESFDLPAMLVRGNFLNHSSLLYRGHLRERLLDIEFPCLDYAFHLRLAREGALAYSNQALVVYRVATAGSVLLSINESVRERYWKAVLGVPSDLVPAAVWECAFADFLRRVAFRAVSAGNLALLRQWWPLVATKAPRGRWRLIAATLVNCLREALSALRQSAFSRLSGARLRVFYFR